MTETENGPKGSLAASTGEFAELVAAGTPTPGGGSVAAYCGQLASALGRMVCNLTAGKPKFSSVEPRIVAIRGDLETLSNTLSRLIEEDADSFKEVLAAYKLPNASEQEKAARSAAISQALKHAIAVPSKTIECSLAVIRLLADLAKIGNPNALSDVATAAQVATAAIKGAYYNVIINLSSLPAGDEARALGLTAKDAIEAAAELTTGIEVIFLEHIR
jgi:formiminotetrahydrofolate cyclodeaminase